VLVDRLQRDAFFGASLARSGIDTAISSINQAYNMSLAGKAWLALNSIYEFIARSNSSWAQR
jgi:hypothetical protein